MMGWNTAVAVPVVTDSLGNSPRNPTRVETIRVNQPTYVCYLMWINRGNDSWVLCFAVVSGISRPLNQIWYFRWFYQVTTHFFPCLLYNQRYQSMHNKMTHFWVQSHDSILDVGRRTFLRFSVTGPLKATEKAEHRVERFFLSRMSELTTHS